MNKTKLSSTNNLFPALLKYWRHARGLSQLDLSLAADVSTRHVSFLETGRANPSREMVLILGNTLQVPLREQNVMLVAAGLEKAFEEPGLDQSLASPVGQVLQRMLDKHEPYPMVVVNWNYDVLMMNRAASGLMMQLIANPASLRYPINLLEMVFDPNLARPFIKNWEPVARALLARLHREVLLKPHQQRLHELIETVLSYPEVPPDWRLPDFSQASEAVLTLDIQKDDTALCFLTTISALNAPHNVTLEEILIESYFPMNEQTERACQQSLGAAERRS